MPFRNLHYDYSLKQNDAYQDIKMRLHRHLIDAIEAERISVGEMAQEDLAKFVRNRVAHYVAREHLPVTSYDTDGLSQEMLNELTGFGPLESLINDDRINDILVNGAEHIFVERAGKLHPTTLRFIDDEHVLRVVRRILAPLGRRLDESSPMVDARLPDGSRVNAIIPPIALDGPCVSIRKFRKDPLMAGDLLAFGTVDNPLMELLHKTVDSRCNILISGGTGAGKTTLLNVMSRRIAADERLITIEDAAELQLGHEHVVRLETRPPNIDGRGEVTARELVRNALRMRPDRIILGEIRSNEVLDVLQAMNTGHDGCMSTVHANNPRDALLRLEMLGSMAAFQGSDLTLKSMIASAIDLIVQVSRMPNGQRRVTSVDELQGLRDGQFVTSTLYEYQAASDTFIRSATPPSSPKLRGAFGAWSSW